VREVKVSDHWAAIQERREPPDIHDEIPKSAAPTFHEIDRYTLSKSAPRLAPRLLTGQQPAALLGLPLAIPYNLSNAC
jgi:hypothetical protein